MRNENGRLGIFQNLPTQLAQTQFPTGAERWKSDLPTKPPHPWRVHNHLLETTLTTHPTEEGCPGGMASLHTPGDVEPDASGVRSAPATVSSSVLDPVTISSCCSYLTSGVELWKIMGVPEAESQLPVRSEQRGARTWVLHDRHLKEIKVYAACWEGTKSSCFWLWGTPLPADAAATPPSTADGDR